MKHTHEHEHATLCPRCGHVHSAHKREACGHNREAKRSAHAPACRETQEGEDDSGGHHSHGDGCSGCSAEHSHGGDCACGAVATYIRTDARRKTGIFTPHNVLTAAGLVCFLLAVFLKSDNRWIALLQFLVPYALIGYRVLYSCVRNILRGKIFDENFLMTLATAGAFVLGEYLEAVAVMIFFEIGERFQSYAVKKSVGRVKETLNILPDAANLVRDGKVTTVKPAELAVGDVVLVKPGDRVPVDAVVTEGESFLDTSSLTGESLPRACGVGDELLSGCINTQSALYARVTKPLSQSTATRILDMVQSATEKKAKSEQFITRFARIYTPIVTLAALFIAFLLPLITGQPYMTYFKTALIFLIVSCPCALVISIPLSFFAAIGTGARLGALFKGSNYLSTLYGTDTVIFDKTGTLTWGTFEVNDIIPQPGRSRESLLEAAAYGEAQSNHPIAKSFLAAYGKDIDLSRIADYTEMGGGGVELTLDGKKLRLGNANFLHGGGVEFTPPPTPYTAIYLASDGVYCGCLTLADRVKEDSADALAELKRLGVTRCVMLTGDSKAVADAVAAKLPIDEVYSEMLPAQKLEVVEQIVAGNPKGTAYVGDGINDVLALSRADVGISTGSTADAAIESADIVIPGASILPLAKAKRLARRTHVIVMENIAFSLAVKLAVMILGFFSLVPLFVAILSDVGCALITVLNALRLLLWKEKKPGKAETPLAPAGETQP